MKKNLLAIGLLAANISVNAQLTFVGDGAKFFVGTSALVYSGGDFMVNSTNEKTVENKGNILIEAGDYRKGSLANAAANGKEFVNVYTSRNNYGQVIIKATKGATDAKMTMEKLPVNANYYGATFPISFPYKDNVNYLMNSFTGRAESEFIGYCGIGKICADIYRTTLRKWNNELLEHDAVPTASTFKKGEYYLLNMRDSNMQTSMTNALANSVGVKVIGYKGTPDPSNYSIKGKGVINGWTESAFSAAQYNSWKYLPNRYDERYSTYLGDVNTTSTTYGKNAYHFGNPYTSNIDLSAFDGPNAWLSIMNNGGPRTIKTATDFPMIRNFRVMKIADPRGYDVTWNNTTGSTNASSNSYYTAQFDGVQWTGSAEALLIRPLETFSIGFGSVSPSGLGGTRIVDVQVNINDTHKTFNNISVANPGTTTFAKMSPQSMTAKVASSSVANSFYQSEIALVKNDELIASPVYLVGTTNPTESSTASATSLEGIYVYGINGDQLNYNNKKSFTYFNINDYVGKPMGIGFNNLQEGQTYKLNFNLTEETIFNNKNNFTGEKLYLLDKNTNKSVEVSSDKPYEFIANSDNNTRFELYWRDLPITTLSDKNINKVGSETIIYREQNINKIRFSQKNTTANVEVYDMSGKLIQTETKVPTSLDLSLNRLTVRGVYIVKITYNNGEVVTLKAIK